MRWRLYSFELFNPLGRLLAASLFLGSAYGHMTHWPKSLDLLTARGLPFPAFCLALAVVVELAGAIGLILGWHIRIAAFALAAFSVVATSLFHANFGVEAEAHMFAKDIALAGALLCLATQPPRPFDLDRGRIP
jgi:putative oxidoreductase